MPGPKSINPASSAGTMAALSIPRRRRGLRDHGCVADGLGRGDEQKPLRLRRKRLHPAQEALLDPARQLPAVGEPEAAGELGRRQPSRQLQQRERVAPRLGDDPGANLLVEPSRQHGLEKPAGIGVAETRERELRQAVELVHVTRVANREHHHQRLCFEPPRDERQDGDRLRVQPLDVVEQADERPLLCDIRQQAERGQPDQEALRRRPVHETESLHQRVTLRAHQSLGALERRPAAQLQQAGERERPLRLDPADARDPAA